MQVSIGISLVVHAAILVLVIVGLPAPQEYDIKIRESVPIEVVTLAELTALRAQTKTKTPEKKKPAPKKAEKTPVKPKPAPPEETEPAPVKPEPPKPKEPAPKPEAVTPKPAPKKEEAKVEKKPEPKPKEKKSEKPKKEVKKPETKKPKPKPKKPKKPEKTKEPDVDFDQIAALLDKTPEKETKRIDNTVEEDGIPELGLDIDRGDADIVTRDEKDALREQIEACWSPPVGAENAGELIVRLRIRLKPDGSLQGPPQLLNSGSSRYFQAASDSAIRAVNICQPYKMPPEKYEAWKSVILNFNPRDLAGG